MNKTKIIILTIITILLSVLCVLLTPNKNKYYEAQEVYRVYLNGSSIGLIKSKDSLEKYIDNEQQSIKKEYNVNKVYTPSGLEIKKETTYSNNIDTEEKVYDEIKDNQSFTIDGYIVNIKSKKDDTTKTENSSETSKDNTIYVLNKKIFTDSINDTVLAFVDEDQYNAYLQETQPKLEEGTEGVTIQSVYLKETITVKKAHIPVNERIFSNTKELENYLLFGDSKSLESYSVQDGDTIASIAETHKLNINEFLIANHSLSSKDALLYKGQQVTVSLIQPIVTVIKETNEVENQTANFSTKTEDDSSMYIGQSKVVQDGVNGVNRVTKKVQRENGFISNVFVVKSESVVEPVDKIIKKGTKQSSYYSGASVVASTVNWGWPTLPNYVITSQYHEWRSYELHPGIDISGTGYGSPIYASNDGTIKTSGWSDGYGRYIEIDHGNGYITLYGHCSSLYVRAGQVVKRGQVIAAMGSTGWSTGTHLHYEVHYNGVEINPFSLYQ